jgi:hypothetical protein
MGPGAVADEADRSGVLEHWVQLVRPSLLAAHKAAGRGPSARDRLTDLAEEPAFHSLSTTRTGDERGRAVRDWLIATVAHVRAETADPTVAETLEDWVTYVATGVTLSDLATRTGRPRATVGEIRYRMGLHKVSTAHASYPAVEALVAAIIAGRAVDLDDPAVAAASSFARARPLLQRGGLARALLQQLIGLPDEPVPVAALEARESRGPLLSDLRGAVRQPGRPILDAARALHSSGMIKMDRLFDERTVRVTPQVRLLATTLFSRAERAESQFSGLRWLLRVAPEWPEDPQTWATWVWLLPHVIALVNDPELEQQPKKHLDRIGQLANYAGVYARFKVADEDLATRLGRRAVRLLQLAGIPDRETYSATLVNLSAVASSREAASLTAAAVAERRHTLSRDDPVLIGTYLAEANALHRKGQWKKAQRRFDWLVGEIEEVHAEVVNDYAASLLQEHARSPKSGYPQRAEELLGQARSWLRPWAHGWFGVTLNLAQAQLAAGHAADAGRLTRNLLDQTRLRFGPNSPEVLDVLDTLLDIADVTHPPDADDLEDEAFRIDDHIMRSRGDYDV